MARKSSRAAAALVSLVLAACAGPAPSPQSAPSSAPAPDRTQEVEQHVREPARQQSEGTQVFPMQNPAVRELIASAQRAEDSGQFESAAAALERALRIQPRDPELLQLMAEMQLRMKDYGQALHFATRSYDAGPRVGELCSRNWRTIGLAHDRLGDATEAAQAERRAEACLSAKPRGY